MCFHRPTAVRIKAPQQRRRHHPYDGAPDHDTDGLQFYSGRRATRRTGQSAKRPIDGDQLIGLVTFSTLTGSVNLMPISDQASADTHASTARQAIEQVQLATTNAELLGLATAEALLAIFHQLKHMDDASITLKGAADLADAMDGLARRLPMQ